MCSFAIRINAPLVPSISVTLPFFKSAFMEPKCGALSLAKLITAFLAISLLNKSFGTPLAYATSAHSSAKFINN